MNFRILFLSFLAIIVLFSSCSKTSLEDKLIGEWKQISVGHIPEGTEITWTFAANQALYKTKTTGNTVTIDTASWSVEMNTLSKNTVSIENLHANIDGKHAIQELDDYLELLRIEFINGHTDGAFQWNEFEKK